MVNILLRIYTLLQVATGENCVVEFNVNRKHTDGISNVWAEGSDTWSNEVS